MIVNGVAIDDTFAEAFGMRATRILVTALNLKWAYHAARAVTGFATSVIGCGCEAGIERELSAGETPDGRSGLSILLFAVSGKELAKQVERRVGQCVLTAPTSAVFAGLDGEAVNLGRNLRFFGDGFQMSKVSGHPKRAYRSSSRRPSPAASARATRHRPAPARFPGRGHSRRGFRSAGR